MRQFARAVDAASRAGGYVAALLLVYMVGHILYEIVLRNLFATSTFVLDEFVGYAVAGMIYLSLAYALRQGSMIRVSLVIGNLRGCARQVLEILCALLTLALTLFLARYFLKEVWRDFERGTTSYSIAEVPVWIPEAVVLLGMVLFALQLVAYIARLLMGDPPVDRDPDTDANG